MFKRELRLGDSVDDYCMRCKLVLDHHIVAIVEGEVRKVRCHTCSFEHPFHQAKGGRPKKSNVKSLFDEVAASMGGRSVPADAKPAKTSSRKK